MTLPQKQVTIGHITFDQGTAVDSSWLLSNEKTQFLLGSQQPSVLFMLAIKSYDFHWILDHKMHLSGLHAHRLCTREMLILSWSYMKPSKLYSKPETRNPYTLKPCQVKTKKDDISNRKRALRFLHLLESFNHFNLCSLRGGWRNQQR